MRKTRLGTDFLREIEDGLRSTHLVVALLSPHAVREAGELDSPTTKSLRTSRDHRRSTVMTFPLDPVFLGPVPTTDATGCLTPGAISDRTRFGPASGCLSERMARERIGVA
jgi:hypothetical protein